MFEEGALGEAPGGGSLATYRELCALATDMGQPDLLTKFMDLANHASAMASTRGAAYGCVCSRTLNTVFIQSWMVVAAVLAKQFTHHNAYQIFYCCKHFPLSWHGSKCLRVLQIRFNCKVGGRTAAAIHCCAGAEAVPLSVRSKSACPRCDDPYLESVGG